MNRSGAVVSLLLLVVLVLASGPVLGLRNRTWGTAQLIEQNTGNSHSPEIAVASGGVAVAVWEVEASGRDANRFTPGGGWGTPETSGAGVAVNTRPSVAISRSGNAVAVWQDPAASIRANFRQNGRWGVPVVISTGLAAYPQVGMDDRSNAVAAFLQGNGSTVDVYANRFVRGVGWGTPIALETAAGPARELAVAVGRGGEATVVWIQWDGAVDSLYANRFVPATGWGGAVLLETGAGVVGVPDVAMDDTGAAMAVWSQIDPGPDPMNIYASRFSPGVGWGAPVLIDMALPTADFPRVAMNPAGVAFVAWQQQSGGVFANRFVPGAGWGMASRLDAGSPGGQSPDIAAGDRSGTAVAVWSQYDGVSQNAYASHFAPATGWGAAQLLESGGGSVGGIVRVGMDGNGNALAVWDQVVGATRSVFANRFS